MNKTGAFFRRILFRAGKIRPCIIPAALSTVFLVFLVIGCVQLRNAYSYQYNDISDVTNEDLGISADPAVPSGITNILLFGVDARSGSFSGLSDSIMIATVDAVHNTVKLTSIMRDSLVKVDGYRYQKINAAYNLGGATLAIKTINQAFGLNIRNYATVDFSSMASIIDILGGYEGELTKPEVPYANEQIQQMHEERGTPEDYIKTDGKQTLNGIQTVAYARLRKVANINGTTDDYGRTERQRMILSQMYERALTMSVKRYPVLIKTVLPYVETSLSYSDIIGLAGILSSDGLTFQQARIPADGTVINDNYTRAGVGSCVLYNLDYTAKMLNAFLNEDIPFEAYMAANKVNLTNWYAAATGVSDSDSSGDDNDSTEKEPPADGKTEEEKDPVPDVPVKEPGNTTENPAPPDDPADTTKPETPLPDTPDTPDKPTEPDEGDEGDNPDDEKPPVTPENPDNPPSEGETPPAGNP